MDYLNICKFLTQKNCNIRSNPQIRKIVCNSYKLFKINRQKLKLGLVSFEYEPLMYGRFIIKHNFNLILSKQTQSKKKQLESNVALFGLPRDFTSVLIIAAFLIITYSLIRIYISNFYHDVFNSPLISSEHLTTVLNQVFDLMENTTYRHGLLNLSSTLADLSIYLDLFS